MADEQVVSAHSLNFWRQLACTALKTLRPIFKLSGEQSAAWDVVTTLVCGG